MEWSIRDATGINATDGNEDWCIVQERSTDACRRPGGGGGTRNCGLTL